MEILSSLSDDFRVICVRFVIGQPLTLHCPADFFQKSDSASFVIGFIFYNLKRPVNLFQQHDAEQLVGEGHL